MIIVVDANLVAALVLPLPYSDQAAGWVAIWERAELLAPWLLEYEVSSALRKAVTAGLLNAELTEPAMQRILDLRIRYVLPTLELHRRAFWWAARLGYPKTYDAQYLAVAEQHQAPFWTADRRLFHAAHVVGATWVHWIEEEPPQKVTAVYLQEERGAWESPTTGNP